jgi:hypothetical protein
MMQSDAEEDDDDDNEPLTGGRLLNGQYDEKNSAASFQQALKQWRQTNPSKKNGTSTHEAASDTVYDTNGGLNQVAMPLIEFHSSSLTYAERLLLKKYRRTNKFSANSSPRLLPSALSNDDRVQIEVSDCDRTASYVKAS